MAAAVAAQLTHTQRAQNVAHALRRLRQNVADLQSGGKQKEMSTHACVHRGTLVCFSTHACTADACIHARDGWRSRGAAAAAGCETAGVDVRAFFVP